jgi:hypothetical protein
MKLVKLARCSGPRVQGNLLFKFILDMFDKTINSVKPHLQYIALWQKSKEMDIILIFFYNLFLKFSLKMNAVTHF